MAQVGLVTMAKCARGLKIDVDEVLDVVEIDDGFFRRTVVGYGDCCWDGVVGNGDWSGEEAV